MMRQRTFLAAVLAVTFLLGGVSGEVYGDDPEASPQQFIEDLADKAVAALTVQDISRDQRVARFRRLFNQHFDVKTIGRWVLGRYWRGATTEERQEFLTLFEDLIVETYVDRFARYSGETLSVTKSETVDGRDSIVFSRINRPSGGPPVRVGWPIRTRGEQYRIVDVMVEGVSMGLTQRSEFASVIRQTGGKVEGLLAKLRERQ